MKSFVEKIIILMILGSPIIGFACNVCRGNPESSLSNGMDMAILTLLGITGSVLGGFATFFVHLKKKSILHQNNENHSMKK